MTALFWIIALTVSLFVGSFLNVVIHRGPVLWGLIDSEKPRGSLAAPRSYCPACWAPIQRKHLIPLASYIALRGKCAACKASIPIRYPLVEAIAVIIGAVSVLTFGFTPAAALAALFGWALLALGAIDWETGFLPDWLTLPLILLGLSANAVSMFSLIESALIGAVAGFIVFWAIGAVWRQLRGVDALGLGDAKLMAAFGAWLGWQALPNIVLAGSLLTLAGVLASRFRGETIGATDEVPFGPGLCIAGYCVFIAVHGLS